MGSGSRLVWLVIGAGLVLLSACGEDEERQIVEPAVSPTGHAATPPVSTPTKTLPAATTTATPSATPSESVATRTLTPTPTPTSTPTPVDVTAFVGTYDARLETTPFFGDSIAEVSVDDGVVGIGIWFNGHSSVGFRGSRAADGSFTLEGQGVLEDDEVFLPRGTAHFTQSATTQRVRGSFHIDPGFGIEGTFVLERPVARVPSQYDGRYRFTFDPSPGGCECATTATFTLATDENGIGTMLAAADELDAMSARQGTFDPSYCDVTASGRLRCVFGYETTRAPMPGELPAGPRFPVTLTGLLNPGGQGFVGHGRTEAPIFPTAYFLGGDWTAVTISPP